MRKIIGYLAGTLAGIVALPALAIGALSLYYAPSQVRSTVCLAAAGVCLIAALVLIRRRR